MAHSGFYKMQVRSLLRNKLAQRALNGEMTHSQLRDAFERHAKLIGVAMPSRYLMQQQLDNLVDLGHISRQKRAGGPRGFHYVYRYLGLRG